MKVRALAKDSKNQYDAELSAGNAIVEAVRNAKTKSGLLRELKKYNPSADTLLVDDISNLVQDLQMAPVKYFEAKPERAVDFSEVAAVVMPDNTDSKVKAAIEKSGMSIEEYRAGDQESRKAVVNKLDGVRFSTKSFGEQYDAWDKKDPRKKFVIGQTSKVLQGIGIGNKTVTMDAKKNN